MNSTFAPLVFSFVGVTLFTIAVISIVYEAFFRYPSLVRQRLRNVEHTSVQEKSSLLLDLKQLTEAHRSNNWYSRTRDLIEQSGLPLTPRSFFAAVAGTAAGFSGLLYFLTLNWYLVPVGVVIGISVPVAYVRWKHRSRMQKLTRQLPNVLDVICRGVKAGQTMPATLQMVADDFPPPISDEFRYCYEQQNLGISYEASLQHLARTTGIIELRILVVALLVQSRSGGSLTELLTNLAAMVRKRLTLQQKVKALTSEGRLQALVLMLLPALAFIAILLLNREYAQVLIDHPRILVGCAISQAVGALVIHKLVDIDY